MTDYTDSDITKPHNLAEAKSEIESGATPTIVIEQDGDSVYLVLLDKGTEDTLCEYWICDADGPGDRDREQAIEAATDLIIDLGIDLWAEVQR